ncbi:MAG: cell division protein FtsQ [Ignavibacteriaceae bacterium]|jgi:cell division septal protein FtsQ|nr:cell division protein FtsQ [Ignavibacteriaceae bacterium]
MNKIVSITLFSFLILLLVLLGLFSTKKVRGEVLQSIDLQGCKLLSPNEYLQFANIETDADLKNYSLSSLREKFLRHPYVSNTYVVIDADKKVSVKIHEKTFEAIALIKEKLFFVTSRKEFIPVLPNTEVLDFAVLTNLSDDVAEKEYERGSEIRSAFTIIRAAKNLGENFSKTISEINLRNGGDITLTLTHANSVILVGKQNLAEKIYTFDALLKQIGNKVFLTTANYIDLRYAGNIFIGTNENAGI